MNLGLLRTFLEVYRRGSITGAARGLDLSQSAVTAQIQSLESRLGMPLFERLPRGVAPTPSADELARRIAPHVDALQSVADWALESADPFARPVRLAGPAELISTSILPCLAELVGRGLRLRVTFGLADELLESLAAGAFDLVVSSIRPRLRAIEATPLSDEEFVLVAAPSWAARIDRELLAADPVAALDGMPLVAYAEDLPVIRRYWRTEFDVRPTGTAAVVVPDLRAVAAAAAAGCGITVLPRYLCEEQLADRRLTLLREPEVPPINTLYLAVRSGTADRPHIAAVHGHLMAHLPLRDRPAD